MEFLDFARPQEPKLARMDVNGVVRRALQFIEPKAREQKVELQAELDDTLPPVDLDQEMFYRALLNILVNGLQSMDSEGVLEIITTTAKAKGSEKDTDDAILRNRFAGAVEIVIRDSGKGMSAEKLEHIFEPFFSDKNRGTGLGLAITRNIIEQHHGSVTVESKEGLGTTFTIVLP
jgi:signal transduction histidine kinase